jgi:hypothetical protein
MRTFVCLLLVLVSFTAAGKAPRSGKGKSCKEKCNEFVFVCETQCKEVAGKHVKECVKQCTKVIAMCESDCEKKQNKKSR